MARTRWIAFVNRPGGPKISYVKPIPDWRWYVGAGVFTDEVAQSVTIGEAQHAVAGGLIAAGDITPIGKVIAGLAEGRLSDDQITLFDGTGVGLQDLAVASAAVRLAVEQGKALSVEV